MKWKWLKRFLAAALLLGYPVLVFVWHPWQMRKDLALTPVPTVRDTLLARQMITAEDIEIKWLPYDLIEKSMILDVDQLIGKVVCSDIRMESGAFFFETMVEAADTVQDRASLRLNQGQAAYAVSADLFQAAGNTLILNQKVDLYVSLSRRNDKPLTDCLLKGVRIIDLRDRRGLLLDDPESTGIASVIILAVDQPLIPMLTAAAGTGTIQLYATDRSWKEEAECVLQENSLILPYLLEEESFAG